MESMSFVHDTLAQRVVFRTGQAVEAVIEQAQELGIARPMIISTDGTHEVAEEIAARTAPAAHWRDAVQHVPREVADAATAQARDTDADGLITVGGGSATGLAKAIALETGLPIIAVPTTYAASEATPVWGITEERTKTTGVDPVVLPRVVVYDADLVATLPAEMAVASGLNALAHSVDSLWAPKADPINRAHCIESARALAESLRALVADGGTRAREKALYGCYLSGVAFASAGSGLHHKICHVLGGTFNLPHAETHSVVLRYVAALNLPAVPDIAADLAAALGGEDAVTELNRLYRDVGAPASLAELGMPEDGIPDAVARVLAAVPAGNPAEVTEENMTALLTAAHHGTAPTSAQENPMTTDSAVTAGTAEITDTQKRIEQSLVDEVVASFDGTADPRLKDLMQSLVRHLHAFIRDVRLTEEEWGHAIDFLTRVGHITDDRRQEFILLSDTLGASMQTIAVNNQAYKDATEATVFGPFFVDTAPQIEQGGDIAEGSTGQPAWVEGTVTDTDGNPVPGARIEVWESDEDGFYDVQYDDGRTHGRAHLFTDEDGSYRFWAMTPVPYPIPHDGPVGQMLQAVGRSPLRAAHLHFMVTAPGMRTLVTHIFVDGDEQIEIGDSVFGVKQSLIKQFAEQPAGTPTPDGRDLGDTPWASCRFDIVLAPADTQEK